MTAFQTVLDTHNLELRRGQTQVLQLNIGKKCNQTCVHCHVNAGPARREIMNRETMEKILAWLAPLPIPAVDITGGAPELNSSFRFLVGELKRQGRRVMDRCNLTILEEPGQENLAEFLADNQVEVVASLPCYGAKNTDSQRGDGVFEASIRGLQKLNSLGYAKSAALPLHLVYNPGGAFLPPPQAALEADYKRELKEKFGIEFNRLFALANVPISRFAAQLRREGKWAEYHQTLLEAFNPTTLDGLMCRTTLNVGWQGEVHDCDFNGMLNLAWPQKVWDIDLAQVANRPIATGNHCFGCTAGAGSSCGGALI